MLKSKTILTIACIGAFFGGSGCTTNLSRFEMIQTGLVKTNSSSQITRAETADQGSGNTSSIIGPGGRLITKSTVGGAYLRSTANSGNYKMSAGLHANPHAKK